MIEARILNGIIYMTLTFLNPKEISRVIFIGFYQSLIRHAKICQPSSLHLPSTVQSPVMADYNISRSHRLSLSHLAHCNPT